MGANAHESVGRVWNGIRLLLLLPIWNERFFFFFWDGFKPYPESREGFFGGSDDKESACNAGYAGSIPGLGRSSREGNDQPLQYSFLENPKDRGAWWATVHGVTKSWTRLSETHTNTHTNTESGTWGQEKGIWLPSYIWTIISILSIFLEQRWGPMSNIFWQDKSFEVGVRKGMLWTECLPKILMLKP